MTLDEMFDKCFVVDNGCWEYSGSCNTGGYGQVWYEGKIVLAHRLSWIYHFGTIPEGLFVLHKCDNRICTNPEHLFLGTHQDNSDDKIAKGRMNDRKGSNNSFAKLNEMEVREIKDLLKANESPMIISNKFKVHPCTISDIKFGRSWKHV